MLVFPSGSGVSKEIFDSLKYVRWIELHGIDSDENNFSFYQFKNMETGAPFIKDEEATIAFLRDTIQRKKIDVIYPAFDSVLVFLKRHEEALGVPVIASPLETCELCFSKKRTYEYLRDCVKVPKVYEDHEARGHFPLFLKPECGYGSRDSYKIQTLEEYDFYQSRIKDCLVCEYLPGDEFTIDCFTSRRSLVYCEARKRVKTVNGLSVLTQHVELPDAKSIAQILNEKITFVGAWFFQVKYNEHGALTLLEIAPRIPGASCLHRNRGANFALLSLFEHKGEDIGGVLSNAYDIQCYKTFENRFKLRLDYRHVFVDFDDTIIIKNKVNTKLLQYLYHCKNNEKKVTLITRNVHVHEALKRHCIHEGIFDEIIQLSRDQKKSEYVTYPDSIFIDDSYQERLDVSTKCPVFNCDMVEALFDEKL